MVNADVLRRLDELAGERLQSVQLNFEADRENLRARVGAEIEQRRRAADVEIADATARAAHETDKKKEALEKQKEDLESIQRLQLLTEGKYRELNDRWSHVFRAAMGAEAVREIVRTWTSTTRRGTWQRDSRLVGVCGQRRKKATKRLRVVEAFRRG